MSGHAHFILAVTAAAVYVAAWIAARISHRRRIRAAARRFATRRGGTPS